MYLCMYVCMCVCACVCVCVSVSVSVRVCVVAACHVDSSRQLSRNAVRNIALFTFFDGIAVFGILYGD